MKWFFYNILFAIGYTLMLPHFVLRMLRRGGYKRGFWQRLGLYPRELRDRIQSAPRVWLHAVSVGEMFVALRFAEALRASEPGVRFVLSTNTSTGHRIAEERMSPEDVLLYTPADFHAVINRVLNIVRPTALILTECELWPNLIRMTRNRGVPVVLMNGRISDSSRRGYCALSWFFGEVFRQMNLLLVQSENERAFFLGFGVKPESITVTGSVKFDMDSAAARGGDSAAAVLARCGFGVEELILVGGSTWPGEEQILLDVYGKLRAEGIKLRLVLVPRHVERTPEVEDAIRRTGLRWIRRKALEGSAAPAGDSPDVLLVDTTGELKNFYACADVIFVGKSLCSTGGQNVIEPAVRAKPIVVGPHMENFRAVVAEFERRNAIVTVPHAQALLTAVKDLLTDESKRLDYGRRAKEVVESQKGALEATVRAVQTVIGR